MHFKASEFATVFIHIKSEYKVHTCAKCSGGSFVRLTHISTFALDSFNKKQEYHINISESLMKAMSLPVGYLGDVPIYERREKGTWHLVAGKGKNKKLYATCIKEDKKPEYVKSKKGGL